MKKILNLFFVCCLILPVMCFAGCKGSTVAKNVKNKTYYVVSAQQKNNDISDYYVGKQMRIQFLDNTFKVEISTTDNSSNYGYYSGTFRIKDDIIYLTITEHGGYYLDYENLSEKQVSVFSSLRYIEGKLFSESVFNGSIYSFTLEQQNKK